MSEMVHYAAAAKKIIHRWEYRILHSALGVDELGAKAQVAGMTRQMNEELNRAHQAERATLASKVAELRGRKLVIKGEMVNLGLSSEMVVFTPRTDMNPRMRKIVAIALTLMVAVIAAFATGAFLRLSATDTVVPAVACVLLAALLGGLAGDALTRVRTRWPIGVITVAVVLGAGASYLVAWISGLAEQSRLLLVVLFLVVAVVAATAWAMTALSNKALDRDALEVSAARRLADLNRVTQDLEVAQVELASIDGAWEAAKGEGEGVGVRAGNTDARWPHVQ